AAARQNTGRGAGAGAAAAPPPDVRIDWSGLARHARRLTVPGTTIGGLTPALEGHTVAVSVSTGGAAGRGGAPVEGDPTAAMYLVNVESGRLTRVPPPPQANEGGAGRGGGRGAAAAVPGVAAGFVFARDG